MRGAIDLRPVAVVLLLVAGLVVRPVAVSAQTTGRLLGIVSDSATLAPLGGAAVSIPQLERSTTTSADGRWVIAAIPAGRYTVSIRLIGYRPKEITGVIVRAGDRGELQASLAASALELAPLVVEAEKIPLIEPEVSATREVILGEVLRELPILTTDQAIELTTGVSDGRFRGGRVGQETYVVDGLAIKNQLESSTQGQALEYSPTSLESIEVITGGYGVEYGSALAGVVSFRTRRGNPNRWLLESTLLTDEWASSSMSAGYSGLSASIGGPVTFLGPTTLFADVFAQGLHDSDPRSRGLTCVDAADADDDLAETIQAFSQSSALSHLYCPYTADGLPHQQGDRLIGFLRLDTSFSNRTTLTGTLLANRYQSQLYTPELKYNSFSQLGQRTEGLLGTLTFDYSRNQEGKSWHLTARLAGQKLDRHLGALDAVANRERTRIAGFGLSGFKFLGEDFVRLPIEQQLDSAVAVPGYVPPGGFTGSPFGPAAEGIFVTRGTSGIANWSKSDFIGGDLTAELLTSAGSAFIAGANGRFYEVESYERTRAYVAGSVPNYARFYPATVSGFVEGDIKAGPLLSIQAGLRVDGFKSSIDFQVDQSDFLAPVISTGWQTTLNPRVGVAGAFENSAGKSSFRVNFARVSQPPDFQFFLDSSLGDSLRIDVRRQGNPNLAFENGRAFDVGFNHVFGESVGLGLTVFRKELTNLVTGNIRFTGVPVGLFTTGDEGTVNGVELNLRGYWSGFGFKAGWLLQEAKGVTSGSPLDETPIEADDRVEFPLAFDRRHTIDLVFMLGRPSSGVAPAAVSASGLAASPWGLVVTSRNRSGYPIARVVPEDPGTEPLIERLPWTHIIDLRLTREFGSVFGCPTCHIRLVFDVQNLLDQRNVVALRRDTGTLAPSLETVEELAAQPTTASFPIPRESERYSPLVDLDGDGLIVQSEFDAARLGAAIDRNDPSLLFGPGRYVLLGLEIGL